MNSIRDLLSTQNAVTTVVPSYRENNSIDFTFEDNLS